MELNLGSLLHAACSLKQDSYLLTDEVCVRGGWGGGLGCRGLGEDLAKRKLTFI